MDAPLQRRHSSPCQTSGNIPGTRRGTWLFIASRWRLIDPDFAKEQLVLLLREWYMHPNGQLPAYEWLRRRKPSCSCLGCLARLQIERRVRGVADRSFLEKVFHKLLLNFTWWVNRKDPDGAKHFPGRLSGPRQYRSLRPFCAAPHGRPSRAVRRHKLDGHVLPQHACHKRSNSQKKTRLTKMLPAKFFEHFVHICSRHERFLVRTAFLSGTKRTGSTTTCCIFPTGKSTTSKFVRWLA